MARTFRNWLRWLIICLITFAITVSSAAIGIAQNKVTAEQVVAAIEDTFGVTVGQRRNHIKGVCATGEFIGNPLAQKYSRSPLFSGKTIPVVARFSLAGGNPKVPDTAKNPRGFAAQFQLPDGSPHNVALLNTPVFGASNPETFIASIRAIKPDPATGKPDPQKVAEFRAKYADNKPQTEFLAKNNPPTSYANSTYFGIHTFKFVNSKEQVTSVRWRLVPRDGEKRLTDDELKSAPKDFLEQKLIERTQAGKVSWDWITTIGKAGDVQDNPTIAWSGEHQEVKFGTLNLYAASNQKGAACEPINFDPLVLSDGIEPTDDPVLLFRSAAYAVSHSKRSSEK